MYTDPKNNRSQIDETLVEQFRSKGYHCEEIREEDSTIIIITHSKKGENACRPAIDLYKEFRKEN